MARICGCVSLLVFILSAIVHISTFIPAIPVSMDHVWPLHLATLAIFGVMAFSLSRTYRGKPKQQDAGWWRRFRDSQRRNKEFRTQVVDLVPFYLRVVCAFLFVYAGINFVLFMHLSEGGVPAVERSHYYLHSHGSKIRDLSKKEYQRFQAYEVRGFSGHWMIFSILPTVYFLVVRDRLRDANKRESVARTT